MTENNGSKKVYIYKRYNRVWHWIQAIQITLLAITGFEIHGSFSLFGFERVTKIHDITAWSLIFMVAFTIFWYFTTGEWKHYIPSGEKVSVQVRYYTIGMFRNEPHPYKKKELSRLNPLQRFTYLGFKLLIVPVMVTTGLLYMFYNDLPAYGINLSLEFVAVLHTIGAFALLSFFLVHVYMTTTGQTVFTNIKAMITGYEEIEVVEPASGD